MIKPIIIAEAGPNHNGKISLAFKLVDMAKRSGADYIKFQTSIPEDHITLQAKKANYQKLNTNKKDDQLQMSKKMSLNFKEFLLLKKYCGKKKIKFLTTAFGLKSLDFIKKNLKLDFIKIPSGEIDNLPYLKKVGSFNKKIILSTGMSNLREISNALKILISCGTKKKILQFCSVTQNILLLFEILI